MNTNLKNIHHKEISYKIIGVAMHVYNTLGYGFLEKVYENSMMVKFRKESIKAEQQKSIKVYFENEVVGDYFADILVENEIVVELKTGEKIHEIHKAQVLNYLKTTGLKLGIILNFGKNQLEYTRLVL
jgi:GxxExxY protein